MDCTGAAPASFGRLAAGASELDGLVTPGVVRLFAPALTDDKVDVVRLTPKTGAVEVTEVVLFKGAFVTATPAGF